MARLARSHREWRMRECLNELGRVRLMRIVTLHAVRSRERLALMRLDQRGVFRVVAIETKRRTRLGEVEVKLFLAALAGLVRHVAGVAAHVERRVPATFLRNVHALRVALQAEVGVLVAGGRLEQLKLVVGGVRVVALDAIAHRRRMDLALQVGSIVVGMAGQAQRLRRRGDQLDACHIFIHPDFVTTRAAHRNRGMGELTFGFVCVTLGALLWGSVFVERHRMDAGKSKARAGKNDPPHKKPHYSAHNLPPTLTCVCAPRMPKPAPHGRINCSDCKLFSYGRLIALQS